MADPIISYKRLIYSWSVAKAALDKIIGHINPNTTLTGNRFVRTDSSGNLETPFGFSNTNPPPVAVLASFGNQNSVASGDHVHPNTCPNLTQASLDNEIANKAYVDSMHESYYRQHSDVSVSFDSVSTTETNLFNGTGFIGANTLAVGDIIELDAFGTLTTTNLNHTAQVRLKFNNSDILNSSQLQLSDSTLTNDLFVNRFVIRVKAIGVSGVVQCLGYTMIHDGSGIVSPRMREIVGSDIAIDTTSPIGIMETYQWGSDATGGVCKMSTVIVKRIQ